MYLLFIVYCLICLNQCQRVAGELVDLKSKFFVNNLPPFFESEVKDNPVWNFDLNDAAEDDAIESSELSGANEPSFTSDFKSPNLRAGFRINKNELRNTLKNPDVEQLKQYEQFKKFKQFEQQQTDLQSLFNLNDNTNENQYPLDENSFVPVQPKNKNSREIKTYTVPKSSFVNFIKDNEYYDYEDTKSKLEEKEKEIVNNRKLREQNERTNFNDIRFKLENFKGKVQTKTEKQKEQTEKGSNESINQDYDEEYVKEIQQQENQDQKDNSDKDANDKNDDEKEEVSQMNRESVPILKHKPKLNSKVIYSDNDEIVITEDKNSTTISVPKNSIDFVDQPSKGPRIRKLKKLRRLRKRIRNYSQNNSTNSVTNNQTKPTTFVIGEGLQKNKKNNSKLENKLTSTEQMVNDEINKLDKESDKILNGQNAYTQSPPTPAPVVHHTTSPATDDHTYNDKHGNHTSGKPPHKPKPSDSKDSIIRIVKVIKNNPKTQQIESNVTLINYSQQIVKDVSKNVLNDALKDVLNNDSKEVHLEIDRPKSSRNETRKYQNDDYIDEDNETNKKSDINHVLY